MKFIGQYIQSFIARFRNDVYLEDVSTGTIASGSNLGLDSNNKIVKAATDGGDLTSIALGSGLTGTSLTGPIPEITLDASQPNITTLAGLTSLGAASATTNIAAGDVTMYNAVNDGNPTISLGSSATNRFEIKTAYNSGAQTLDEVYFNSYTTSSSTNDGRYIFQVDEVELLKVLDSGIVSTGFGSFKDNLTVTNETASSATEGGTLKLQADDGATMGDNHRLGVIEFKGAEDASSTKSIGARIQAICRDAWDGSNNDADLEFYTTDGTTESKVLTLDADKLATFTGAATITGLTTLSGNLTFDSVALTAIQASSETFADNDTSLMTSAAIDDAIVKGGSVTYINILPHEFLADEAGGGNKSAQYDDTDAGGGAVDIGVSVGSTSASLFAFTDIPVGKTATHVTVFGSNAGNAITVYESNVKTGTLTSKGTGSTDTGDDSNIINITDVAGTSTNYLVIKSAIAATTNTIYGAQVTISG